MFLKRVLPLFLTLLIFSFSIAFGTENPGYEPVDSKLLEAAAEGWLTDAEYPGWKESDLGMPYRLEDLEGNATAWLYPVVKDSEIQGYMTLSGRAAFSPLFMRSEDTKMPSLCRRFTDMGSRLIYLSAFYYFAEYYRSLDTPVYIHLPTMNEYSLEKVSRIQKTYYSRTQKQIKESRIHWKELQEGSFFDKIKASAEIPNSEGFNWYRGCGPTSIAMILRCYGRNGFPSLNENVQEFWWCGQRKFSSRDLHDAVADACGLPLDSCEYEVYGATAGQLKSAFESVASDYGYYMTAWVDNNPVMHQYRFEILEGDPICIAIYEDGGPGDYDNHAIMGYGYNFGAQRLARIYDTWSRMSAEYALENFVFWSMIRTEPGAPSGPYMMFYYEILQRWLDAAE